MNSEINSSIQNHADRVRNNTSSQVNQRIDQEIAKRIQQCAHQPDTITQRIQELEQEWDTERVLEANAALLAFMGLVLGLAVHPTWFWLTGIVLPFLFQHAVQGWCPPLPIIRRIGVRTRNEIDQEKYALKVLRGDFDPLCATDNDSSTKAEIALQAVKT